MHMALPLGLGMAFGWYFLPRPIIILLRSLFFGTALAITAIPVAIKVLMDMNKLETKLGQLIISAAVIDDVLSLVLLAVMTAVIETGSIPEPIRCSRKPLWCIQNDSSERATA